MTNIKDDLSCSVTNNEPAKRLEKVRKATAFV